MRLSRPASLARQPRLHGPTPIRIVVLGVLSTIVLVAAVIFLSGCGDIGDIDTPVPNPDTSMHTSLDPAVTCDPVGSNGDSPITAAQINQIMRTDVNKTTNYQGPFRSPANPGDSPDGSVGYTFCDASDAGEQFTLHVKPITDDAWNAGLDAQRAKIVFTVGTWLAYVDDAGTLHVLLTEGSVRELSLANVTMPDPGQYIMMDDDASAEQVAKTLLDNGDYGIVMTTLEGLTK